MNVINIKKVNKTLFPLAATLLFSLSSLLASDISHQLKSTYPTNKVTIVGAGIIGALHAYYAYQNSRKTGVPVRVTMYEKNKSIADTTTSHIVPSLTPDEILSVIPRGKELVDKLKILFSEPGGIRVDDVENINSQSALHFIEQAEIYSKDHAGYQVRTQTLLEFGKMSMDLWQQLYDDADPEFKRILIESNFNPCREPRIAGAQALHDGYRIDLIYNVKNAQERAENMKRDYESLGYKNCTVLLPDAVMALDPFLADFCKNHAEADKAGALQWHNDSVALWRPGGCFDSQVFLPLCFEYLKKAMGTYINDKGQTKDCFALHFDRNVQGLALEHDQNKCLISGINFADGHSKQFKKIDKNSSYIFCPGEAVGTLNNCGIKESAYAGFAGATLMLNIPIPPDKIDFYSSFNHCMEVHQEGVVLAWQARFREDKIFIGVAGTKAFYGDQRPEKNQAFAKNRNLLQLNMINDVLPEFISLALGRDTLGQKLTEADLMYLENNNIAERWVGTRAVVFDGFPTLGVAYTTDGVEIANALITTHLGSGGASFAPAAVLATLSARDITRENSLIGTVCTFAQSDRVA